MLQDAEKQESLYMRTIDFLIKLIAQRFNDKLPTVRQKALKVMNRLLTTREGAINDIEVQISIFEQNVVRLQDSAAIVRKNALRLFQTLVLDFGARLGLGDKGGCYSPFAKLQNDIEAEKKRRHDMKLLLNTKIAEIKEAGGPEWTPNTLPNLKDLSEEERNRFSKKEKDAMNLKKDIIEQGKINTICSLEFRIQTIINEAVNLLLQVLSSKT